MCLCEIICVRYFSPGQVKLSPSVVALVCEAGDQLELTCNSSSPLHTWKFTAISESGAAMTYETPISDFGPQNFTNFSAEYLKVEYQCSSIRR